ncbi:DUF2911 domain-containing protein [Rhodohalobacter mucosus]|uniref:DUF2911 domain-containing protein n=1 Tax=Rhodohalobacter mucosus TaxID=2079485 RepID=A0A316TQT1_9BACT|nr:DUF2911 domain-containing protein [Rhodohalobacter mucosus]PWN06148.1 hypothetical protein DDZ15_09900 [Rhodohalobacter mucosus]
MIKYSFSLLIGAILMILTTADLSAQERQTERVMVSPNASVSQTIGLTDILVTYGRPAVRDREIFGGLVPFGEVWRTGANESTVVVFPEDVRVQDEMVPAGTYSLYTIPGEDEWTVIFNNLISWGTQYDEAEDFLRVMASPEDSHYVEQMMIYFENVSAEAGDLVIHWANTKVPVTVEPVAELPDN